MDLEQKAKKLAAKLNQLNQAIQDLTDELKEDGPQLIEQARQEGKTEDLLQILKTVPFSEIGKCDFQLTQLKLELGYQVYPI